MNSGVICVDMDETIEGLLAGWLRKLNKKYNKSYKPEDITSFNLSDHIKDISKQDIYSVLLDEDLYDDVYPFVDAQMYLKLLINKGFDVYIATNTDYRMFKVKLEKVLFRYFPFITPDKVICIANKQLLRCDVLVDDYIRNLVCGKYKKILYTTASNTDIPKSFLKEEEIIRCNNWSEVYNKILEL